MKYAFALFALMAAAAPAYAGADDKDLTAYEFRLDVSGADTPEGAARLYADIRRHAVRVCRPLEATGNGVTTAVRQCRQEVAASAVRAIDNPRVAALFEADTGDKSRA
jgi:UrcA family protein